MGYGDVNGAVELFCFLCLFRSMIFSPLLRGRLTESERERERAADEWLEMEHAFALSAAHYIRRAMR